MSFFYICFELGESMKCSYADDDDVERNERLQSLRVHLMQIFTLFVAMFVVMWDARSFSSLI